MTPAKLSRSLPPLQFHHKLASFSPLSLSHLYLSPLYCFFPPLPPLTSSSHLSILLCSLALCGESAVTVCPSSCGPSCLGQMGSSPPQPWCLWGATWPQATGNWPRNVLLSLSHNNMEETGLWCIQIRKLLLHKVIYRFTGTWKQIVSTCHCEGNNQGTCSKVGGEGECLLKLFQNNTGSQ